MPIAPVIQVDEEKCTSCHHCISVCPVKFCNTAEEKAVKVNPQLCIGCGECLKACSHDARIPLDDLEKALAALQKKEPVVAVVAPAAAANFPGLYENLNGWLKKQGVEAVFDVSFGAELTVKSYLEYIKAEKPKAVIAQPCPALVSFIEIYRPQLIPYLAPADSPMVHTMKMIREFYPRYREHQFLVVSPCLAKRREFDDVGMGDFNVTMANLSAYLERESIDLSQYPAEDYDNDPAERAVLFSTPGGLMRTAAREVPSLVNSTRKIEGPHHIYKYLAYLEKDINDGCAPLLIDALNCDMGCNGGSGTLAWKERLDCVEQRIEERRRKMQKRYALKNPDAITPRERRKLQKVINRYWKPGLYGRSYQDRSDHFSETIKIPDQKVIEEIYGQMLKHEKKDILNCGSCGYGRCERMAIAIHNGINTRNNCLFYMEQAVRLERNEKAAVIDQLSKDVLEVSDTVKELTTSMEKFLVEVEDQHRVIAEVVDEVKDMVQGYHRVENTVTSSHSNVKDLDEITQGGAEKLARTNRVIKEIAESSDSMFEMLSMMNNVVSRTNLLSMNAAIEAAHAGDYGRGFAVVAEEIRELAESAFSSTNDISASLKETIARMKESENSSQESGDAFGKISEEVERVNQTFDMVLQETESISYKGKTILDSLSSLTAVSSQVKKDSDEMRDYTENIIETLTEMVDRNR